MEIRDLPAYVGTLLEKNDADLRICKKFVRVQAEQGVPGQKVETILKDGHKEVAGVVKVDNEGNPDWIITNPSGEKYTCPHAKFIKKYELEVGLDGKHAPISSPIVAVQVPEDITFFVPWGENGALIPFDLRAGGYLNITNLEDIYGIARDEFQETYAECTKDGIFLDKNLRIAFGQAEFNMDDFIEIKDLPAYVEALLKTGADLRICKKFVRVQAEQGVPGQEVETILKDGHKEVAGVVKVDNEGNPDWIITNPSGEKYTCPHSKFIKKYELEAGADGKHAPISSPIVAVQVPENITFSVPWGENGSLIPFNLRAGGYLNITNLEDIYGIARDEFQETYAECTKSGIFLDKNLRKAFEQDEFNMDNTDELF